MGCRKQGQCTEQYFLEPVGAIVVTIELSPRREVASAAPLLFGGGVLTARPYREVERGSQ
jgi:hypothetical protein